MSRTGLAVAVLLAALSARAQTDSRSASLRAPAGAVFVLPPAAALSPSLVSAPLAALDAPLATPLSVSVAPEPAAAAPVAAAASPQALLPPAQARAAAMGEALADFARADLKTAPAGEARDAGEALMLRALGAGAPDSSSISAESPASVVPALAAAKRSETGVEPKVYRLSKPLRETVELSTAAIIGHVAITAAWEIGKAAILYKTTGSLAATVTGFVFELVTSAPLTAMLRSLSDLGWRYQRRKLAVIKGLARTPGLSRVKILTTGSVEFKGPFAWRKENVGHVFVEAGDKLPARVKAFGAPIPIDVASSRMRLTLVKNGAPVSVAWTPMLQDVLDGRPMPPEISAAWRGALRDLSKVKDLVEATLTDWIAAASRDELDGYKLPPELAAAWRARGSAAVRKMLDVSRKAAGFVWASLKGFFNGGLGDEIGAARAQAAGLTSKILDAAKAKESIEATLIGPDGSESPFDGAIAEGPAARKLIGLGPMNRLRSLFGTAPRSRAIPISDSVIEHPGDTRAGGLLRRAWRRLTGRLIVVKDQ